MTPRLWRGLIIASAVAGALALRFGGGYVPALYLAAGAMALGVLFLFRLKLVERKEGQREVSRAIAT